MSRRMKEKVSPGPAEFDGGRAAPWPGNVSSEGQAAVPGSGQVSLPPGTT